MRKISLHVLFFVINILFLAPLVSAKEYSLNQVDIQTFINKDSSMNVVEERQFNFQGDYRFVYQYIDKNSGREEPYVLSNFKLCEKDTQVCYKQLDESSVNFEEARNNPDNTFVVQDRGGKYYLQWHFQANYELKSFVLSYTVDNAITRHEDIAELYWQFIGQDWEVASQNVKAKIYLPKEILASQMDSVKAFGHGPINAQVNISALPEKETGLYYVLLQANDLPLGKFFEGRILLPKNIFLGENNGFLNLASILTEEESFIQDTVDKLKKSERLSFFYFLLAVLLFILGIFLTTIELLKFFRLGKDKALKNLSGIWEPPSDNEPALVLQILTATSKLNPKVFTATVLSLVAKKLFKITRSNKKEGFFKKEYKYFLEKTNRVVSGIDEVTKGSRVVELASVEKEVYEFLTDKIGKTYLQFFDEKKQEWVARAALGAAPTEETKKRLALIDIGEYIKAYPSSSFNFFKGLEKVALSEGLKEGYFERESYDYARSFSAFRVFLVPFFSFILLFLLGGLLDDEVSAKTTAWASLGLFVAVVNLIIFFSVGMIFAALQHFAQKRSKKGWEEASAWKAFKKHMFDYKKTKDYSIDSIILWEKYLIYGTLFGVSMKALSEFPVHFSDVDQKVLTTYWGVSSFDNLGNSSVGDLSAINLGSLSDSLNSLGGAFNTLSSNVSRSYGASGSGSSGGFSGGAGGGGGGGGGGAG